jgi:hypothetical protein
LRDVGVAGLQRIGSGAIEGWEKGKFIIVLSFC